MGKKPEEQWWNHTEYTLLANLYFFNLWQSWKVDEYLCYSNRGQPFLQHRPCRWIRKKWAQKTEVWKPSHSHTVLPMKGSKCNYVTSILQPPVRTKKLLSSINQKSSPKFDSRLMRNHRKLPREWKTSVQKRQITGWEAGQIECWPSKVLLSPVGILTETNLSRPYFHSSQLQSPTLCVRFLEMGAGPNFVTSLFQPSSWQTHVRPVKALLI